MPYILNAVRRRVSVKAAIFLILCMCSLIPIISNLDYVKNLASPDPDSASVMDRVHISTVENFYEQRVEWPSSKLGGILFHREPIPNPNPNANRTYKVLVWKYWDWLKNRHVLNYGKARHKEDNLLEGCSVKNCVFTGDDSQMDTADAVLIHLQRGLIPEVKHRNRKQRWIFLNDESPKNKFSLAKENPSLQNFYDVFNWSMTYRSDADVPVPYGRTVALERPVLSEFVMTELAAMVPNWNRKRRDRPVALLMSNCGVQARNDFVAELKKYIHVDVYGKCSDNQGYRMSCPGHFKADCDPVAKYLFYLVLENTSCFQYLTEKGFYHAYEKGAIPVIFGPSMEDVESLLPPHSYLFVDAETSIETVANNIKAIADNNDLILGMHMWRNHFKVVNEHGYFGTKSYHLCRLCEALNYNDESEKIYDKERLDLFLDPSSACYESKFAVKKNTTASVL
ncbi:4-galactosyl-N-acetylglucosaminide 3-alpha-L-fucosyltransferase 9 [Helicoverpa armigera]|uniref:4-galactosyl-N-acetylglucosaminide 3-alpha-L-fucosyltransferase 9 n=1 Tax=Helicoverpa armigera TaxID=29058 RepID=UPI0030828B9E